MINVEKLQWDLQTVTASDYTLEIKLNRDLSQKIANYLTGDSNQTLTQLEHNIDISGRRM